MQPIGKLIQVRRSLFWKLFQFFLLLIVFFVCSFYLTYRYYVHLYGEDTKRTYESSLVSLGGTIDTLLQELNNNTYLLTDNRSLLEILYEKDVLQPERYNLFIDVREALSHFLNTKDMIESITIAMKDSGMVVSTEGTVEYRNYFSHIKAYTKYPVEFWSQYTTRGAKFRVLPPSEVVNKQTGQSQTVVPIVMQEVGMAKVPNLFIINLSTDYFVKLLNEHKLTDHSVLYILDKDGRVYAGSEAGSPPAEIGEAGFTGELSKGGKTVFNYRVGGQKMLVITNPSDNLFLEGFSYAALVPYRDLERKLSPIQSVAYFSIMCSILLSVGMSYLMSNRVYRPIRSLVYYLKQNRSPAEEPAVSRDEVDYINAQIGWMMHNNEALSKGLTSAIPLIREKYLLSLLGPDPYVPEHEFAGMWEQQRAQFPYPDMTVAAARLGFTDKFRRQFEEWERSVIYQGIKKIAVNVFPREWRVHMVSPEKNMLILIVNLPKETAEAAVSDCVRRFLDIFRQDEELMTCSVGIGGRHKGEEGIPVSYREALRALGTISPYANHRIRLYKEEAKPDYVYTLQPEEENRLYNYLLGGRQEEALELLRRIAERNAARCLSDEMMRELHLRLCHPALKAMEAKSLEPEELLGDSFTPVTAGGLGMLQERERMEYVERLYEAVCQAVQVNSRLDIRELIRYIDGHYAEDLYLDQLADKYGTSGKYLSRLLKHALGIPFQQYLGSLRIDKAKELLISTDMPVQDIAARTGFNTKTTFLRIFRKHEGVTPSEYRSLHRTQP